MSNKSILSDDLVIPAGTTIKFNGETAFNYA